MVRQNIVFADEKSRIGWEIGEAVRRISNDLPPEGQNLEASLIRFAPEDELRGTYAIFFSGTVIGTDSAQKFFVPKRSVTILRRLGIPFMMEAANV